jgi:D-tyrosyl-tRNA(Tyr) deacylase
MVARFDGAAQLEPRASARFSSCHGSASSKRPALQRLQPSRETDCDDPDVADKHADPKGWSLHRWKVSRVVVRFYTTRTAFLAYGAPIYGPIGKKPGTFGENKLIGLIQRVSGAKVEVSREKIAEIGVGLLVLIGVERGDGLNEAKKLAARLVAYRVFADEAGKMNRNVREAGGAMLLVPQFTLAADTSAGLRPSFSKAARPEIGAALFDELVASVAATGLPYARGRFGAEMRVTLTNDGPVTFWLQVPPSRPAE